jgi:A/G-specific adenine glycosylase
VIPRKIAPQNQQDWPAPALRTALLTWYHANKRDLPWRGSRDPYAIWVSEIMLQQTRVAAVLGRYQAFMARFPTVTSLALAPEQDVLALWSGLGYYRRARLLHQAAQHLVAHSHATLPATAASLRRLPGIGGYTAAAIASIAHGEPTAVVDGNVERVLSRLAGWSETTPGVKRKIEDLAAHLLDLAHPGDFNQAMMELGATVCLPRNPQCPACPLFSLCQTRGEHPTTPRPKMQTRPIGYALALRTPRKRTNDTHTEQEVLLEQRHAAQSVMPLLWELPMLQSPEVPAEDLALTARHSIMQVNYDVRVRQATAQTINALTVEGSDRRWIPLAEAAMLPLTGLARKILTRLKLLPK